MADYKIADKAYRLVICDHILDNIYGQVGLTEVEKRIERLPVFKRLHSLSQLGLVNWIFPCALHNRYVHSIGVMYVAGEMATRINSNMGKQFFADSEIQILRLAGLLHDIGHYPFSHNVENAYKAAKQNDEFEKATVKENISKFVNCPEFLLTKLNDDERPEESSDPEKQKNLRLQEEEKRGLKGFSGSTGFHHEQIGASIISKDEDIKKIVRENFVLLDTPEGKQLNPFFVSAEEGKEADTVSDAQIDEIVEILMKAIAEMVRGNYDNAIDESIPWLSKYSLMIQIIHSDMDADNLDYLLRDATFSGTSYGIMDMGILLNNLYVSEILIKDEAAKDGVKRKYLLGITKKGIGAVEQFLHNKFLAYSQMILSKYVSILEAMLHYIEAENIVPTEQDYSCQKLKDMTESPHVDVKYLAFTDHYLIQKIYDLALTMRMFSKLPKYVVDRLAHSCAFDLDKSVDDGEYICISLDEKSIIQNLCDSELYKSFANLYKRIKSKKWSEIQDSPDIIELFSYRFENYKLTKMLPFEEFIKTYQRTNSSLTRRSNLHYYRLANGIPILEKGIIYSYEEDEEKQDKLPIKDKLPLLCVDSPNSSLSDTYKMQFVALRKYIIAGYGN